MQRLPLRKNRTEEAGGKADENSVTYKENRRGKNRRKRIPRVAALCLVLLGGGGVWIWRAARAGVPGAGVEVPEYVEQALLPVNEWSRPGTALEKIDGVVIHYVGNPGTAARANRNYFASLAAGEEETYASAHFVVGLEGEVLQCVPLTEQAYASNLRNGDTVSVEVCHPDESGEFSPVTYQRTVDLTAWLCREFGLDPETDVIRHYDVSEKICPKYYVENPRAWERFRADVAAAEAVLAAET